MLGENEFQLTLDEIIDCRGKIPRDSVCRQVDESAYTHVKEEGSAEVC